MDMDLVTTLASLLASRALVDKTNPEPVNLRNGWRTDALMQDVDAFVVISLNNPAAYAQVGRLLLEKVRGLPEMTVMAALAIFRGERLLPMNPAREQMLVTMSEELEREVLALADGARKERCKSLLSYHKGVFFDTVGRFDLAAQMQKKSEQEALGFGDQVGAAIAGFLQSFYQLKYGLREGGQKELESDFLAMELTFDRLSKNLQGSALQTQWAEANAPCHMIDALVWIDQTHPKWDEWVQSVLTAAPKLGIAFAPGEQLVRAMAMDRRNDPQSGDALRAIGLGTDANDRRATALLMLVRRALKEGRLKDAHSLVASMPIEGAQHIVAIAQRLLV